MLDVCAAGKTTPAVARRGGIELRNGIYSLSEAAIRCYAESGSERLTENGWRVWKTASGATLNDLHVSIGGSESPAGLDE
jgi:hypothetical protein